MKNNESRTRLRAVIGWWGRRLMMSSCHVNSLVEKLKGLVTMNENLKQQEQEFRTHCRVSAHTHTPHTLLSL